MIPGFVVVAAALTTALPSGPEAGGSQPRSPKAELASAASPSAAPETPARQGSPEPLTLEAALDEAAGGNLDLQLAHNARARSDAGVLGTYRAFLPRLDVSATFGRDYIGSQRTVRTIVYVDPATGAQIADQQPITTPAREFEDYALNARVEQRLFDGLRSYAQTARAQAEQRAAQRHVDEATLAVAFEVTRSFYEVVKAEQSLAVLEQTAAQSQELVARADALYAAGRLPRSETLSARVNLGNDTISVESQRARLTQARADLAVALGRAADPELRIVVPRELGATGSSGVRAEPPAFAELLSRAREARPAHARERELVRAAELGRTAARADYFPALGLSLSYARQGPELHGATGVYGPLDRQYVATAQAYVQWNLFDGLGTLAAADLASAEFERARLTAEQVEQAITVEVASARANLVALNRATRVAEDNLASADAVVRLARERFDAGAATQLEVRDAQLKLTQARLAIVSTRSDRAVAFAALNRAVGGEL